MPLPNASFDVAETLFSGFNIIQLKPASGAGDPLIFAAKDLSDDPEQEVKPLDLPRIDGSTYEGRSVSTKMKEKWTFGLLEYLRLLDIFDGHLIGRKKFLCTIWQPDPQDAAGKVALQSQADIPVTVSRDGKVDHGNGEYSKSTIKIESNSPDLTTWTPHGDA